MVVFRGRRRNAAKGVIAPRGCVPVQRLRLERDRTRHEYRSSSGIDYIYEVKQMVHTLAVLLRSVHALHHQDSV